MLEYAKLVVELVKAIAWPSSILGVAFLFRHELRKLVPRVKRVGPTGVEFDAERQLAVGASFEGLREFPGNVRTRAISRIEIDLHKQIGVIDEGQRVDLLIRQLAQSRLETHFERVYRNIFGSQISGLKLLSTQNAGQVAREGAKQWFEDEVKSKFPDFYKDTSFETWLQFLINMLLVESTPDSVTITEIGRDYLTYMSATGLPEGKNW
jgi:hypothetical protein